MNRRDFCLSLGMFAGAGALASFAEGGMSTRKSFPLDFRVKIVNPRSWYEKIAFESREDRIRSLRAELRSIKMDADAVLIASAFTVPSGFIALAAASRGNLDMFLPSDRAAKVSCGRDRDSDDIALLAEENGLLVTVNACSNRNWRGLYFRHSSRIVLCDVSRGTWNEFPAVSRTDAPPLESIFTQEEKRRSARLASARLLDDARKHLV